MFWDRLSNLVEFGKFEGLACPPSKPELIDLFLLAGGFWQK